jgi:cellulose synthase/poly-beta-1,6-N-acetylglucosamine synthase-like glycosyltransferase
MVARNQSGETGGWLTGVASKGWFYRLWEIIPGLTSWLVLLSPIIFSLVYPIAVAYFIIAFDLLWLLKSVRMSVGLVQGYLILKKSEKIDWQSRLKELEDIDEALEKYSSKLKRFSRPGLFGRVRKTSNRKAYESAKTNYERLGQIAEHKATLIKPSAIHHVVITAVYNESIDVLRPSLEAILGSEFDPKKIIFVLAYEQRGGEQTKKNAEILEKEFSSKFGGYLSICHPSGSRGELPGKGANITYAGKIVKSYLEDNKLDPENVIVTTLDSDHRPDPKYLPYLTYEYCKNPNRDHFSYQPMAMFLNNIWDAPAPMRVIATGNSFWLLMESVRHYRLRNFAAHAQGMKTLLDTDFWSVTTIVEDGHQYWRTFYAYDGDHLVEPLYVPVYQDAVLADNYRKTFANQYKQLRRWAYGASDIPFVVTNNLKNHRIPFLKKWTQFFRLFEGHLSWATAPLILTFAAWAPLVLNSNFTRQVLAHQLPVVASRILTIALVGQFVTILLSLLLLPPRPKHYHKAKVVFMIVQWVLVPVTSILFGSTAALDAQTRLLLGKYPKAFDVTEKAVKK